MAKIKDLKFEIAGEPYVVHVNCNSKGEFSANLPGQVSSSLGLDKKLVFMTVQGLEKEFLDSIKRYKAAETSQQVFIFIKYSAAGKYSEKENGHALFSGYSNKYNHSTGWGTAEDVLGFSFKVCIMETVDGHDTWYAARKGSDFAHWNDEYKSPEEYFKGSRTRDETKHKIIPFSPEALKSLEVVREKIRSASEILFNFIEQEEPAIEATLRQQKSLL